MDPLPCTCPVDPLARENHEMSTHLDVTLVFLWGQRQLVWLQSCQPAQLWVLGRGQRWHIFSAKLCQT